ncbi:response regulator [Altererythrobacter salegens]|uniref:Response regulator n=1 Tax=Croceibacterium salegens TaxID=1737568 RepID=A0A6I4STV6_9SPHN|nr:response regulator [Croceibacterium salegens]MXO58336.1 response regulator [Croceibacterium salegens]
MCDSEGSCHVLLLEDEPMILMDLEFAAEACGCNALCATSVKQAMKHLDSERPVRVGILDVNLGEGQTCEPVARELERRGIPYILHSGDLDRQNETVRSLNAQLIPKPANANHVISTAMECVGRKCG